MLQGESLGSGEGQIVNESKSGFEGLRVWAGWSGATERTKGQSRGSEAGKRLEEWSGRRGAPVGCLNSGLFTAVGGKNPTLLEFAWFTGVHTSDAHGRTDVSPARCRWSWRSFVPRPYPLRLSVITVSLRSRHPPGGLNLLINLVLIVCAEAPIMSWFVYILAH